MKSDKRTYQDRKEYLKVAVSKRRQILKIKAVHLLGGACAICGYNKHPGVLDFHHVDPAAKSFGISSGGLSRSWKSIESELKKCVLLCANCHREVGLGLIEVSEHLQPATQTGRIDGFVNNPG